MKHLKTKILIIVASIVSIVAIAVGVYAYISRTSTRGEIEVSAATITAETTYTAENNEFGWVYNGAGDTKQINITTSNQTGVILHRFYNIELTENTTSDSNLLKAIIVYYNDNYVGTLNDIIDNNPDIEEEYNFIGLSSNKTDNFKFELHQAAHSSIFDGKNVKITITTYTENADYFNYIFVNNEAEFKKAVDDVNSGLFENIPSIVLCSNITLENSYIISNPVTIYLNGSTLNGALTLNDTTSTNPDALLEVLGTGSFNVTVTLGANYNSTGALALVKNHIKEVLANGLAAGSTTNILGYYSFYNITVAAGTRSTYTAPNVVIANTENEYYNALGSIRFNDSEDIIFKILGTKTQLIDETLAYMPSDGATITSDLFLPTYIPSQNANITWTSSDESIITSSGMITADRLENADVTLYAEIKVNNTIITRSFKFKVSAHNNEINFYKMVQEISPIVINNVRNSAADDNDALYHLPIINVNNGTFGLYDYRTSYKCPVNTELFDWQAFKDIGLENITYSVIRNANNELVYDYITLENGNELYLNTVTLQNYAKITITGDFGNSETYTTDINISISVGSNTQLLEKAFTQVSEELAEISVLGNILKTRIANGMNLEKGDFSLKHAYTDPETNTVNEEYTIEYSGEADIISSITYNSTTDKYDFAINPEYFNEYETTVAFTATVYYRKGQSGETSKSRTFYVTVPAALHVSDFGTISIYNSTKYQVFNQLPDNEKSHTTGYTVSGTSLTDSNLDYILLRDIVGDANYLAQYNNNNTKYLDMNNITSSNYAKGTETLSYQTAENNPTSTTDTQAYDFARLIEWATGNTRATAASVVSNTSALVSGNTNLGNTKANAEDYLNNDEIAVLKQYYISCTGATNAEWESLFSEVFNVAPGYIYTNPALLNTVIKCLSNQITGDNFRNGFNAASFSTIFGKYMEVIQRYAVSTTKVNDNDVAPCQEIYNTRVVWTHTATNDTTIGIASNAINVNGTGYNANYSVQLKDGTWWQRFEYAGGSAGDGGLAGIYARPAFAADRTSYITEEELTVLRIFLLNCVSQDKTSTTYYLSSEFSSSNLDEIEAVINENPNYYSNYERTNFRYIGQAILNAFNACLEIPTYFATDGVDKIIKSFYDKKNYDLPTYDGTTNTTPFVSSLSGSIPYITNADNIKSVLSYFTNLKTLTFNGNSNLAVFLSENGLSTVFARTGLYNTKIENLTMKHVAHSSVNFDLSNIKNFTSLKELDLSNNTGIQSVNELVNVNRSNYTYVDISYIGVENVYQEFALDNLKKQNNHIWYYDSTLQRRVEYEDYSNSSILSELSDFNKFISQYMYMTNVVYDSTGTGTSITWRIDEGNEINSTRITKAGKYNEISSVSDMNQFVSPYYYCNESFTYRYNNYVYNFEVNHVYKLGYSGNNIQITDLALATKTSSTSISVGQDNLDTTNYSPNISTTTSVENIGSGTESTLDSVTWYTENGSSVTVTLSAQKYWYSRNRNRYLSYNSFDNIPGVTRSEAVNNTTGNNANLVRMLFLEYSDVDLILNKKAKSNTTITKTITYETTDYYLCFVHNNQLYMVGSKSDTIEDNGIVSVTTNLNNAYTFRLVQSKINNYYYDYFIQLTENSRFTLRMNQDRTIYYHSRKDGVSTFYAYSNGTSTSVSYDYYPSITVEYIDGDKDKYEVYSAGYDVVKIEGTNVKYTDLKKIETDSKSTKKLYYLYTGTDTTVGDVTLKSNTIIQVYSNYSYKEDEISREYISSGATVYIISVWYKEFSDSDKVFVDEPLNITKVTVDTRNSNDVYVMSSIRSNYPNNIDGIMSSYTYIYDDERYEFGDDDYSIFAQRYSNFTSVWELGNTIILPYASYTAEISSSNYSKLEKQTELYYGIANNYEYVFRYTGTTGSENTYDWSIMPTSSSTYTNKYGYKLIVDNNRLFWAWYANSISDQTTDTMDSILETANQHFYDYQYGVYYGMYYGFNGTARYISSGIYVRPGYVYRIMPNVANTAFEWVEVGTFVNDTADNILQSLGTGGIGVDTICYATSGAGFGFFDGGQWYKVVLDEKTNIVNLVKFNDVGFLTNGASTYTQLTNDKLVPKSIGDGQDYLGYSGTFTIQISAMIRVITNGVVTKEYIKTYKLKFVGSLYE